MPETVCMCSDVYGGAFEYAPVRGSTLIRPRNGLITLVIKFVKGK